MARAKDNPLDVLFASLTQVAFTPVNPNLEKLPDRDYFDYLLNDRYKIREQDLDDFLRNNHPHLAEPTDNEPLTEIDLDAPAELSTIRWETAYEFLDTFDNLRNQGARDAELFEDKQWQTFYEFLNYPNKKLPAPQRPKVVAPRDVSLSLWIEPKLKAAPERALKDWAGKSEKAIRKLTKDEVEYYIHSPRKLPEFQEILSLDGVVANEHGESTYQYRLHGLFVNKAVEAGLTNTPVFHKYDPDKDGFFVTNKSKYGLGVVRLADTGQYGVVLRNPNGPVRDALDEAGLLPTPGTLATKEITVRTLDEDRNYVSVAFPLPENLARSIARAHGQPEIEDFLSVSQLLEECLQKPALFAPAVTEQAAPAPKVVADTTEETIDPRLLLGDALKLYGTEIQAKRVASGGIRYRLVMQTSRDWKRIEVDENRRAEIIKAFPEGPTSIRAFLSQELGYMLVPGASGGTRVTFEVSVRANEQDEAPEEYACFERIASYLGTSMDKVEPTPFLLGSGGVHRVGQSNLFRYIDRSQQAKPMADKTRGRAFTELASVERESKLSREVTFYLMYEQTNPRKPAVPQLVAVANRKFFSPTFSEGFTPSKEIFTRFGLQVPNKQPIIARTLVKSPQGLIDSPEHFTARISLPPTIYRDLRNHSKLPKLKARNQGDMINELGIGVFAENTASSVTDIVRYPGQKKTVSDAQLAVWANESDDIMVTALENVRERLYLAKVSVGDKVIPRAYAIMPVNESRALLKQLQPSTAHRELERSKPNFLHSAGRRDGYRVKLVEIPLTDTVYDRLAARELERMQGEELPDADDYKGIFLNPYMPKPPKNLQAAVPLKQATDALRAWTDEEAQRGPQNNTSTSNLLALRPLMLKALQHVNARTLELTLASPEAYDVRIAELEPLVASAQARLQTLSPIRGEHEVLESHIAKIVAIKPSTQVARKALGQIESLLQTAEQLVDNLQQELADTKRYRDLSANYGQTLPAIVVRGGGSLFNDPMLNKMGVAMRNPGLTEEGETDVRRQTKLRQQHEHAKKHPERVEENKLLPPLIEWPGGALPRAILDMPEKIPLGKGKRGERVARMFVLSPELWKELAERQTARPISRDALPYNDSVRTQIVHHYDPEKRARISLPEAFKALHRDVLIAHERGGQNSHHGKDWRPQDKGAQPCVYMVATPHNRDKVLQLIGVLQSHDGIIGTKQFAGTEHRATDEPQLLAFQERVAALHEAAETASRVDTMAQDTVRLLGMTQQPGAANQTVKDAAERLLEHVQMPKFSLMQGQSGATRALLGKEILQHVLADMEAVEPKIIQLLEFAHAHGYMPNTAEAQADLEVLRALPSIEAARTVECDRLEQDFLHMLQSNLELAQTFLTSDHLKQARTLLIERLPADADEPTHEEIVLEALANNPPDVWALEHKKMSVEEAVATHAAPRITLVQKGAREALDYGDEPEAHEAFSSTLKEKLAQGPVILSFPISPEAAAVLKPHRAQKFAPQERVNDAKSRLGTAARDSGRWLNNVASSDQGYPAADIALHLARFVGLETPQAARG